MDEIHRFTTKTLDLIGINPKNGEKFAHTIMKDGQKISGPYAGTFHIELRSIINKSRNIDDFNSGVLKLITDWKIDPKLLPSFPIIK